MINELKQWLYGEICERRNYSASKAYETVIEKIHFLHRHNMDVNDIKKLFNNAQNKETIKTIKMLFEWQIDKLIRDESFGDDNGLTKSNVLKSLDRTLSGLNFGNDIDVTTRTQMIDNKRINTPEKHECDIKGHFYKDEYMHGRRIGSKCVFCGKTNGFNGWYSHSGQAI